MRNTARLLFAALLSLVAGPALAQCPTNLPANSLMGRLGIPTSGGPCQAIPFGVFSTLPFSQLLIASASGNVLWSPAAASNAGIDFGFGSTTIKRMAVDGRLQIQSQNGVIEFPAGNILSVGTSAPPAGSGVEISEQSFNLTQTSSPTMTVLAPTFADFVTTNRAVASIYSTVSSFGAGSELNSSLIVQNIIPSTATGSGAAGGIVGGFVNGFNGADAYGVLGIVNNQAATVTSPTGAALWGLIRGDLGGYSGVGFIDGVRVTSEISPAGGNSLATVTVSSASPGVVTDTGHLLVANQQVMFSDGGGGGLPVALSFQTVYYVKTVIDANTFTVSATRGGAAINTASASTGTVQLHSPQRPRAGMFVNNDLYSNPVLAGVYVEGAVEYGFRVGSGNATSNVWEPTYPFAYLRKSGTVPTFSVDTTGSIRSNGNTVSMQTPPVDTRLQLGTSNGGNTTLLIDAHAAVPVISARASAGTMAAPTASQSGNVLLSLTARGFGATQYSTGATAAINFVTNANFTDASNPTHLDFYTTPAASVTAALAMVINADKTVKMTAYGAGIAQFDASGNISSGALGLTSLATQAANTVLANATSGVATPTAFAMTSCSTAGSAITWVSNSGFNCNTSISAATATIVDDTTTNASMDLVWATTNTGSLPLKVSSSKLQFNPSTGSIITGVWNAGAVTSSGAVTSTTHIPTGSSAPTNGMYLPAANTVGIAANSTFVGSFAATNNGVVQFSNSSSTSTATPFVMDFGGTFSSTAGANPKWRLYNDGSTVYGLGLSSSSFDVILGAGGGMSWYLPASVNIATVNTGGIAVARSTAIPSGGGTGNGYYFSSTANFGIFFGSGAPTMSAAKGSLYLRSDGTGVADRIYVNTSGSTTWTNLASGA